MGKIDELILQYCPEGVEYVSLGKICDIKGRIGFRGYTRNDQVKEGEGALSLSPTNIQDGQMDYSKGTYITWAKYEESPEIMTYNGDIIFCKTASVGKVALVKDLPYKATINPQLVVLKDIQCNAPFLAYILGTDTIQNKVASIAGVGSVPNISQKALSEIEIPLPPLPVQEEIVSILDTFTNLQTELQAELQARQEQYLYYQDLLLNKSQYSKHITIGELCVVKKGNTPIQKAKDGKYPLVATTMERRSCDTFQFNTNAVCIPLVSSRGHGVASLNHIYYQEGMFALGNILCAVIPNDERVVKAKYLYYYLEYAKDYTLVPLMKGGANVSLHCSDIEKVKIPLPSLSEQERIISILDSFDTLVNDLFQGLPAEIEARRQQHEYYRDQLLTFKRKEM